MDIMERLAGDGGNFPELRASEDRYFARPLLHPRPGPRTEFAGKECIQWSTNNYLGLAENEELHRIAAEVVADLGLSSPMGSRLMTGNTRHHEALEARLAEFVRKESSLVFSSGYLGVSGCLSAILERDDIVLMDEQSHACMFDGARLSQCHLRCFKHNDLDDLEATLKWARKVRKQGLLIATEGVFGMRGDIAPLGRIVELKETYEATLFVDDAHGFGVMGELGAGTPSLFERGAEVDFHYGTFSKAFASIGGMVASTRSAVDWLTFNARSNVFTKSLPLAYVAVIERALDIVRSDVERRKRLFRNAAMLKDGLRGLGFDLPQFPSPITALFLRCESLASVKELVVALRDRGVFVTAVVHPVVPKGVVCIRLIPTASHTEEQIACTLAAFKDVLARVNLGPRAVGVS